MANISQTFVEGASINIPPLFADDKSVWDAIINGLF